MRRLVRFAGRRLSSRILNRVPNAVALGALALAALGAASCESYHYFDMDVQFGQSFSVELAGNLKACRVEISGADSHEFSLGPQCGLKSNNSNYPDVGIFEFATFADSGTLSFTVNAYNGIPPTASCLFGTGAASMKANSDVTQSGTIKVETTGTSTCATN